MKLMIVIVQEQDYDALARLLIKNRIRATKFRTEGLYSSRTNITLLICVESEREKEILEDIRQSCTEREEECKVWEYNGNVMVEMERTLKIGGATIFISDVERSVKFYLILTGRILKCQHRMTKKAPPVRSRRQKTCFKKIPCIIQLINIKYVL